MLDVVGWMVGDWGMVEREWKWKTKWKNNQVLVDRDKNVFLIWSNGQKQLSHGGKQLPFSMLNPTYKYCYFCLLVENIKNTNSLNIFN